MGYINELIEQCAVKGGSEGLDIGIDVLSQFGELTLLYAREFWKQDWERWSNSKGAPRHHFNDDAWYILLRAAARSSLEPWQKMQMLLYCSLDGTESIREAGIHAIGDMGGPLGSRLLRRIEKGERSPLGPPGHHRSAVRPGGLMAEPPTLAADVKLPTPVFLRKLRRRQDWGSEETPIEERAADLVKVMWKCEPHPESPFSVYVVNSDEDFQRVVIGMNGGRPSLTADSDYIALLPADLAAAGVEAVRCPGVTLCRLANALHHDIPAKDHKLLALCLRLLRENRQLIHLPKKRIKPLEERARTEGCMVVLESTGCKVRHCP